MAGPNRGIIAGGRGKSEILKASSPVHWVLKLNIESRRTWGRRGGGFAVGLEVDAELRLSYVDSRYRSFISSTVVDAIESVMLKWRSDGGGGDWEDTSRAAAVHMVDYNEREKGVDRIRSQAAHGSFS
jgi:hypothetical protein